MFPVWPIVKVENLIASLQQNKEEGEGYILANAVAAATIAQLKLKRSESGVDSITGAMFEAECQRMRRLGESPLNHTSLRIAFFLHVYWENQEPGGMKSLLYLREAVTIAQMIKLHREESYQGLTTKEDQLRRRILWLLFVTER